MVNAVARTVLLSLADQLRSPSSSLTRILFFANLRVGVDKLKKKKKFIKFFLVEI